MARAPQDSGSAQGSTVLPPAGSAPPAFLRDGGEMGALMRAKDWSKTPLGPVAQWSASLRTTTSLLLANRFPMLLWWGPDSISIYNDAYIPVLGLKHPGALGLPVRECWSEIYDVLRPLIETPLGGGPPTWSEDLQLDILRHGFLEETHWTVAYSPVPDETAPNGIGGVLATVHEITSQVIGDRRGALLRDLGAQMAEARTAEDACAHAAAVVGQYTKDVPFALIYLVDEDGRTARLARATGIAEDHPSCPERISLTDDGETPWAIGTAVRTGTVHVVDSAGSRFTCAPTRPFPDLPPRALVLPLESSLNGRPSGVVVLGLSPLLALDSSYRGFAEFVATRLGRAVANARAYEAERRRADALAELDRAKTTFFSNVSHELRTPLTLMLGPVEDVLADATNPLSPAHREHLTAVHRNAMRLLKLVNSLLDFSRIEAGRIEASYEPTDLGTLTAELASSFRSLAERAGLALTIDCPPPAEPVFVDSRMWEKIVLNLLSNAFKFTFAGEISVRLESDATSARLVVRDTGTGVDAQHLPHIFERFYRIEGARGRTQEGTGIGLALVRELARLHGGSVSAESQVGRGSAFTVSIPLGSAHLPQDRVRSSRTLASTAVGAVAFLEEASEWLETGAATDLGIPVFPGDDAVGARIVVADDNADMRAYLARLLRPLGRVETVADGLQALAAVAREAPDLVLSDVMMPGLDGFGLLRALRADERTRSVPVILLSARAGEEARLEGLAAGVDDYVVKPFAARELVARVRAQLLLARQRREHTEALRQGNERLKKVLEVETVGVMFWDIRTGRMTDANETFLRLMGYSRRDVEAGELTWQKLTPPEYVKVSLAEIEKFKASGRIGPYEKEYLRKDGTRNWFVFAGSSLGGDTCVEFCVDIADRKMAEEALARAKQAAESEQARLETILEAIPDAVVLVDAVTGKFSYLNKRARELYGVDYAGVDLAAHEVKVRSLRPDGSPFPPAEWPVSRSLRTGKPVHGVEMTIERSTGERIPVLVSSAALHDSEGRVSSAVVVFDDITERKRIEDALARSKRQVTEILESVQEDLYVLDREWRFVFANRKLASRFGKEPADFVGRSVWELFPRHRGDVFEEHARAVMERGETRRFETAGKYTAAAYRMTIFPSAEGITVLGIDVTEQKKAADALRSKELELREAQRIAQVGSWRWDAKTDAVFASEELLRIFGRTDCPVFREQRGVMYPPEEWDRLNALVEETLRRGADYEVELRAIRADGAEICVNARGTPVRDATGAIVGLRGTAQDVTERRRAQDAIRESEARVSSLTNNLPESLVYQIEAALDGTRRFTFLSGAVTKLFGCTPDEGIADATRIYRRFLAEDQPRLALAEKQALTELSPFRAELRFHTVSGGIAWAYVSSAPRRRPDGRVVWDGILVDITERRRTEEALRSSEERLQAHMDNSPLAVIEFDREFHVRRWSRQAERLFGWSAQEVVGRAIGELRWVHEDDLDSVARESAGLETGARPRSLNVNRNYRKDGSVVYCEWYSSALHATDGTLVSVLSQVLDVTARTQAEQALRDSEQQLRAMYEQNPAMVVLSNLADGCILEVNEGFTRMLGFSAAEAVGHTAVELGILPEAARQQLAERIRESGGARNVEVPARTKSGALVTGLLSAKVLDIGGQQRLLTFMADITDRKRVEVALEEANQRLLEADRRKNEFLAVLSHELRNPLAPIRNSAYILGRAAPGGDQASRALAVIDRQAGQLARLVDDLLDVTRITRNKIQLQRQTLELNELVRRTIEDQRSLFEKAEVHLELVPAPERVYVSADWNRLAQVVGNLLQNSAKFTGRGGTTTVTIERDAVARRAVIRVADTGVGMAPDMVSRLFQPFSQADSTLDRSKGGLGLGLALVKGLVELHGGDVAAHSGGLGRGAEFIVRLPLSIEGIATPPPGLGVATRRRRVLVIEDNVDAADTLRDALALGEHDVAVAYNGPDGIATAREFRPEVVLCDIGLPGMDGYEVARAFRADDELKQAYLVALSGYALPEDLQRASEAGFARHLAKPPSLETLSRLLAEVE